MNLGTLIAEGNTAKIYLIENKIIKVFNDHLPDTESTYEANKQKFAYSCGLSVPKVLDVTKIDGKQAIIMEYIKGRTIGDILSENKEQADYFMSISVDVQQKIHKIPATQLESMSNKLKRQISSAVNLDKKHKTALIKKLDSMSYEKRLCHGDYHIYNLIMSDNEVTIIDWVDSSAGDIRADVYRTYLLYSQFSIELADIYLRLYCEKSGLSKDEVFEWAPIIAGARLSENVSTESSERLLNIVENYCSI
ncbi:aminoglycoside phosphotransferase [Heyndrickxia shackletonii]|uniref:Aminoglycoside phosphotransferase n=1 Tax=Heyndrickxia shackletonii TaxID=157838 RepID=A0A0Q3TL76_9BACI|nr:aminoglycoside phosphotransferase family protein [Heyndrickxia shackletonii]KQL54409.1 aminoglycoside phosphotransferase [Heyndrickxia shackletonii]NEY99126.1 aminoglycoside phosphotransferase family protein [Heyndrickxia shackletonii]